MAPTVHLTEPLADDQTTVECDAVELKSKVAWIDRGPAAGPLVVPIENLAGVEGDSVDQDVEHLPAQGGQYSEVVTRIS